MGGSGIAGRFAPHDVESFECAPPGPTQGLCGARPPEEGVIHAGLSDLLERIVAGLRADPRCLAAALTGSLGAGTADAHSDVDLAAVLEPQAFGGFCAGARAWIEGMCGPVAAWLPEGQTADGVNFAFLYRCGDDLLLCDLWVVTPAHSRELAAPGCRVLFERDGFALDRTPQPAPPLGAADVRAAIDTWWVYAYLNGKYLRRSDAFKLAYVQGVLLQAHVRLLNALLEPGRPWTWWARDAAGLPHAERDALRAYLGSAEPRDVRAALQREMDLFGAHARRACALWRLEYPADTEAAVRQHLAGAGVAAQPPAQERQCP